MSREDNPGTAGSVMVVEEESSREEAAIRAGIVYTAASQRHTDRVDTNTDVARRENEYR